MTTSFTSRPRRELTELRTTTGSRSSEGKAFLVTTISQSQCGIQSSEWFIFGTPRHYAIGSPTLTLHKGTWFHTTSVAPLCVGWCHVVGDISQVNRLWCGRWILNAGRRIRLVYSVDASGHQSQTKRRCWPLHRAFNGSGEKGWRTEGTSQVSIGNCLKMSSVSARSITANAKNTHAHSVTQGLFWT